MATLGFGISHKRTKHRQIQQQQDENEEPIYETTNK
jgi:hypothetical protein